MGIKEKLNKKPMKLLALLLTSMLIATVSAQIYKYMYIEGSISVTSAKLIWILGDDAPSDASIAGSTATIDLDVEQGVPMNFTEALFLKNVNATGSFNILINTTTPVSSGDFQRAKMHIYTNSTPPWTFVNTLDLTNATDSYSGSIAANQYLRMTFEVNATIASGSRSFQVQVRY